MLLHWWHANKQQSGRGSVSKESLEELPILDVTSLSPTQIAEAVKIFDEMQTSTFLPLHEIHIDNTRKELDEKFMQRVLKFPSSLFQVGGPFEILRLKLSREPSIRGSKK